MARQKEFDREVALDKAMRLFWEKGYEATSIQDLVERMGINRGSLYDTFGDKHQLYLAALDRYQQREGRAAFLCLEAPASPLAAIRQTFANLVQEAMTPQGRCGCFAVNAAVELAAHDPAIASRAEATITNMEETFCHLLVQAQQNGELRSTQAPRTLARFLVNGVLGIRTLAKMKPSAELLQDVVETTLSVLQ